MIGRLLLSIGVVAASVGLTLYGMATSYATHNDGLASLGIYLMIGGVVGAVIGFVLHRATERSMR